MKTAGPTRTTASEIATAEPDARPPRRAVLYLRVSTPSQVNTDYDPEGLSIPAQRTACERKAAQINASIVDEYSEPGRSGTRMESRPAFQEMLERIKRDRDVDYVIVYKLSRMNRNRVDDALVLMSLRKYGVSLISATESIDETPVGQLMHGILAAFNEFRSAEDGADIKYKMGEKARRGGTLGRAPLGYQNIRDRFEGREVRSVAIDPERAPFVQLAFELYASGEYTLIQLAETLTDRGLRTRPGRYPAGPVSDSKLQAMLRDRYYIGSIIYQGVEYPGRHEALVSEQLFDHVQTVLDAKSGSGERQRVHHHYLKGSIWCGRCHDEGRETRMLVQRAVGRRGVEYFYFFCRAKQEHVCSTKYIDMRTVEEAVVDHYGTVRFTPEFAEAVQKVLGETLGDQAQVAKLLRHQLTVQHAKLDRQEENLLDLASDGAVPKDKLRARLLRIQRDKEQIDGQLEQINDSLDVGAALVEEALRLLDRPQELYRRAGPKERRLLNQAIFSKLYIDDEDVTASVLAEPFAELVEAQDRVQALASSGEDAGSTPTSNDPKSKADLLVSALSVGGWSKTAMVEVSGLEPPTSTLRT
jgi:site-specific DNA recombinase